MNIATQQSLPLPPAITTENPYTAWSNLASQITEMMTASAQVISHRSTRMAMAGLLPTQRDQDEFSLMKLEKIDALSESTHAITLRMVGLQHQVAKLTLQQLLLGTKDFIALAVGTFVKPMASGRNNLIHSHITHSAEAMSQLNASLADVAHTGLQPLYTRATANAKRLASL
ncbi:polyhydroxyalkanoate granule-associated phasin [Glaciimonas sp. GG7]